MRCTFVLQLVKGELRLAGVCRGHNLRQSDVEAWIETFLKSGKRSLKINAKNQQVAHQREVGELRAKVGKPVLELDARKKLDALLELEETPC